ncbi:6-hydroxymethylpterin diphosphokinase MptE-like protein [Beggiatoa leptomitoformis]|uniref:DUF115 domain-containing protein n=1 Tax=Beggiatoa leptomitoformis TaxID=288004 RepID=A0A2N9YCQ1_9GAMM|nr:6-hydroxymethylpterin diphosphokinase MptE-like protein [Beggiatoa leptomitoformis]ALG66466.1 DUF115 domain-containing protein [Beggiatoa leptomitoformis]AUI68251.1 DUF115 domain-containing protein [Beggiatoa leptomitoformis]
MSLRFIHELKRATAKKRMKMLMEMQEKNFTLLKKRNPELANAIKHIGTGEFRISITDDFLEVSHIPTKALCHPDEGLFKYITELGHWHHTGWIDKLKVLHEIPTGIEHGQRLMSFAEKLHTAFPAIYHRMATGSISLPRLADGRRFSGATVFLGTFMGLQILHYLQTTEIRDIVIVEPDVTRFSLSCFFVDYAEIEKRFGRLVLHVGPDMPENPQALLIDHAPVTSTVWLRLLPAYPSDEFTNLIQRFELHWRGLSEVFVPFDREVRNLCYGARNLQNGTPINYQSPVLSDNSRIVIVASGPSLDKEIPWLKENQDKLIIFAAHSAVRTLKRNGIRPDYQCSLDTELQPELLDKLELDPDIPFVSYYKANPDSLKRFKTVLLVNEAGKANPVRFTRPLTYTHPTTGNLMVATASFAKPKQLYLIGLDLGFHQAAERDHVKDYWAHQTTDDEKASETEIAKPSLTEKEGILPASANFTESEGKIYTQAYHNIARRAVEAQFSTLGSQMSIFNLSDGVKIENAEPCHSETLFLTDYPEKSADLALFQAAFTGEQEGVWTVYRTPGKQVVESLRNAISKAMTLKKFDWLSFAQALDHTWSFALGDCLRAEMGDLRVEAYSKLIQDLLVTWYRVIIFTETPRETEQVYKQGLEILMSVLGELEWQAELTTFEEAFNTPTSSKDSTIPSSL